MFDCHVPYSEFRSAISTKRSESPKLHEMRHCTEKHADPVAQLSPRATYAFSEESTASWFSIAYWEVHDLHRTHIYCSCIGFRGHRSYLSQLRICEGDLMGNSISNTSGGSELGLAQGSKRCSQVHSCWVMSVFRRADEHGQYLMLIFVNYTIRMISLKLILFVHLFVAVVIRTYDSR